MFTHEQIWQALDRLAESQGLSPSGMARRAGLDPTTFNISKRESTDGKRRWPSTESIAKVLQSTGLSLEDFSQFIIKKGRRIGSKTHIPVIAMAQAAHGKFFDETGFPVGAGWDQVDFPNIKDDGIYALEVSGDTMAPTYREGDLLIISPQASVRRGDRVIVKTRMGEVMAKILARQTATRMTVQSLNPAFPDQDFDLIEIEWMARIMWASQ